MRQLMHDCLGGWHIDAVQLVGLSRSVNNYLTVVDTMLTSEKLVIAIIGSSAYEVIHILGKIL